MVNPLAMSDEDFLKQAPPEVIPEESKTEPVVEPEVKVEAPVEDTPDPVVVPDDEINPDNIVDGKLQDDPDDKTAEVKPATTEPKTDTTPVPEADKVEKPKDGEPDKTKPEDKKEPETPDYQGFYNEIMKPFKANGKMIELKEPSEAIALMQMGANYTKKLQELQPAKKILLMLENNKLLDEDRLSFAIDLVNKDPEAIKKLLIDAKIDPVEIDTTVTPAYREGNHRVTDEQVAFTAVVDELKSSDDGKKTLQAIHTDWDDASKDKAWADPRIINDIHTQRSNGVYERITSEMERQRVLGKLPTNLPFLQAYKFVGDHLVQNNGFADLVPKQEKPALAPIAPVATRVAAPKPTLANSDKAKAAAPTRTVPRTAKTVVNPLAMSDDEFLEHMKNRV